MSSSSRTSRSDRAAATHHEDTRAKGKLEECLSEASAALGLSSHADSDLPPPERWYGRRISPAARAAADLIENHPQFFDRLTFRAKDIREGEQRAYRLDSALSTIESFTHDVTFEWRKSAATLATQLDLVQRTVQATIDNPNTESTVRTKLAAAAQPLFAVTAERAEAIRTGMARADALRKERKEKDAAVSKLEIRNRFLSGEELRPEDFDSTPPAARSRRRTGRTRGR